MSEITILFVEDKPETAETAMNELKKAGFSVAVCGFDQFENQASEAAPDIVVLDILEGDSADTAQNSGIDSFDWLWGTFFRPIVFYSAFPDRVDEKYYRHAFVKRVQKGSGSEALLLSTIKEFEPYINDLRVVEGEIRSQLPYVFRDVADHAFRQFPAPGDAQQRQEIIRRAGRRRLAGLMDILRGDVLEPWEQYITPPITEHYMLGDVLRPKAADPANPDPSDYRIVLTPTCDLAENPSKGRKPKATSILVARCHPYPKWLDSTDMKGMANNKLKEKLPRFVLMPGYYSGLVPLPEMKGVIPHMAADVKDLQLIPLEDAKKDFVVAASIDSPFREMISWAYIQMAGRVGLPDRNCDKWCDELLASTSTPVSPATGTVKSC